MRPIIAMTLAAAALASACATEPRAAPPEFTVVEANASVSLRDVRVRSWARDRSILLQTFRGDWYRAELLGGCMAAGPAEPIGFVTPGGAIDRGTAALIDGQQCALASFSKIQEPPPGSRY